MREAVIVAGARTAVGKAKRGSLKDVHPVDMGAAVVSDLLRRVPELNPAEIEDVIMGTAVPEAEQGMNMARLIGLRAGLPTNVPGITVNRFCSSGLQTIAYAAQQIIAGGADVIVAGGVESMSLLPMAGHKVALNPTLMETMPEAYMSMGHTAEEVAKRYGVSREDQDAFALQSHQRAAAAIAAGKFRDEIVPLTVKQHRVDDDGKLHVTERVFDTDEGVRADTSLEALAKLKPVFHVQGTVTAGNSSQTSDGAAAVLVMSAEKADSLGVRPIARFRSFTVGGVDPDVMGIGPVVAIPKALKMAGLSLADVDLFELNEAFASQSLAVIRELGLDPAKVNVNGGAIALGHPLGCTGAKLTVSLLNELKRRGGKYGVVTMCIGGGMGAAGVFEML
ncbi:MULTISPECIES: acetyl-CoA C-acetyltransferase [Bacillales]|jgi:acetyl-CoA acyltransferase|uniref:acetyl-CoA C-acetyltransferase n=1 Tax=Brevibacillus TaxID=55080 RepID=UPI000E388345|nr:MULTISPECIES: acetyl-CoA C-acetyltransferase [Bacillales]MBR8660512.1 acetyl-CoA C-acetyltransferase [Brevibacillus sp. NL20B1]NNV03870.1 acetyl-CoA C-acetyltransferase [Brevibacillus sp. MCWH]REK63735.1 MAG: acetyl-CoA C-acetyltransferase [Brevibacillus sp.]UFJ61746.1 acetyl-CoA C-acetyltransferase [Anoxybacillus sediminis]